MCVCGHNILFAKKQRHFDPTRTIIAYISVVLILYILNIIRITLIILVGEYISESLAIDLFHEYLSAIFLMTVFLIFLHKIIPPRPALVPIDTSGDVPSRLEGLSLQNVTARVLVNGKKKTEAFGEMIFTHFGLSGPIILTLSRTVVDELHKKNRVEITIDLKPALDEQKGSSRQDT